MRCAGGEIRFAGGGVRGERYRWWGEEAEMRCGGGGMRD